MQLTSIRPMLWSVDLQASIDFYTNTLGFTCISYDEDWQWATLQRDDVNIMVACPNEHMDFKEPRFTGSIYITTSDVDGWWNQLKDRVRVCYPVEDFEYGMREFAIFDNNGYILQFGQEMEPE